MGLFLCTEANSNDGPYAIWRGVGRLPEAAARPHRQDRTDLKLAAAR
jgi:hypothetical protein